jgi:hypothetical protein
VYIKALLCPFFLSLVAEELARKEQHAARTGNADCADERAVSTGQHSEA